MRNYSSLLSLVTRCARYAPAFALAALCLVLAACGDTYRPIAIPILQPGGDPQTTRVATVINNNNGGAGSTITVDATGDTNIAVFQVGKDPVHGAFWLGSTVRIYVANRGDDSVSYYAPTSIGSAVGVI